MTLDGKELGMHSVYAALPPNLGDKLGLVANKTYAIAAVEIPPGYRLATEEDQKGEKPKGTLVLMEGGKWSMASSLSRWSDNFIYLIPDTPLPRNLTIVDGDGKVLEWDDLTEMEKILLTEGEV